jgi:hypothetical protein
MFMAAPSRALALLTGYACCTTRRQLDVNTLPSLGTLCTSRRAFILQSGVIERAETRANSRRDDRPA